MFGFLVFVLMLAAIVFAPRRANATEYDAPTGTIRKVAFAAYGTALPTAPALGEVVAEYGAGWTVFGQDTDDEYLDDGNISFDPLDEGLDVSPPLAQNTLGRIIFKRGIKEFKFPVFSISKTVMLLDSTASETEDGMIVQGTAITYRCALVEITGRGWLYFPKLEVGAPGLTGAVKKLVNAVMECKVIGDRPNFPAGWAYIPFVAAGSGSGS